MAFRSRPMLLRRRVEGGHHPLGRLGERVGGDELSPLSLQDPAPFLDVGAGEPDDEGHGRLRARCTACTTPCATQSHRLMPAKMFTSIALTLGSESTRRNARRHRSGDAPPPTSRKLAGEPPACLIMSMVAIARPAPLMMQPISPSSAT